MSLFSPDYYYESVQAIDLEELASRGVSVLLVDLDNTLLPRDTGRFDPSVIEWVQRLPESGFRMCLVSNNWHAHVGEYATELEVPIVAKALKPFPHAFKSGLRNLDASPADAAVIGDQMFTDILGGNLLGMTTVLVSPLSSSDLPHTLVLRRLERLLLAGRQPLS